MTTVAELITDVRRDHLSQGHIERRNRLAAPVSESDTLLSFAYDLDAIQPHSLISIGLEDIYVFATNGAAKSADVDRGADGTTPAAHEAGAMVRVTPRWTDAQILRAVNSELEHLYGRGLFRVGTTEFVYDGTTVGWPIDDGAERVYRVQAEDYGGRDNWITLSGWTFEHNQDAATFPTGNALFLRCGAIPGRKVRVTWFGRFAPLTALDQDVTETSGLGALELLRLGTAISLLVGREVGRNFHETQGNTRRAEEVPPGAESIGLNPLLRRWTQLLEAERLALIRRYPEMS